MKHDVQDGRDAAERARASKSQRPRPIRYDHDTWLVMRNDPVLPAAIIIRLRSPDRSEFFVTVTWDLDPDERRMIGRFDSLQRADEAVRYTLIPPVVGNGDEDLEALRARQEAHALELERAQTERRKMYGP